MIGGKARGQAAFDAKYKEAAEKAAKGDTKALEALPLTAQKYVEEKGWVQQFRDRNEEQYIKDANNLVAGSHSGAGGTSSPDNGETPESVQVAAPEQNVKDVGANIQNMSSLEKTYGLNMEAKSPESIAASDAIFASTVLCANGGGATMAAQYEDDKNMSEFVSVLQKQSEGSIKNPDLEGSVSLNQEVNKKGWVRDPESNGHRIEGTYVSPAQKLDNGRSVQNQYRVTVMDQEYVETLRRTDKMNSDLQKLRPSNDKSGKVTYTRLEHIGQIEVEP